MKKPSAPPGSLSGTTPTKRAMRLAKEFATLSTSLPCSIDSAIFIRVDETRLDCAKVIITGPSGTPYAYGMYEFDVFFPEEYPASPPHVLFKTTGGGSVRFNPNLYNCGKVCLSLLGTWRGSASESWHAGNSTFLQVLISIQCMILCDLPFFNEPGYGMPDATNPQSVVYNRSVRINCARWAILEQLRHPPHGFADVVKTHFRICRSSITKTLREWAALEGWTPARSSQNGGTAGAKGLAGEGSVAPKPNDSAVFALLGTWDKRGSRLAGLWRWLLGEIETELQKL
ncbi:Baculoviral IAP repeat-containing protein 6 [Cladochytrium tenue]|nr:Baculoviral IAP repeat-containing protein 6 [Cladochytrium tenue]